MADHHVDSLLHPVGHPRLPPFRGNGVCLHHRHPEPVPAWTSSLQDLGDLVSQGAGGRRSIARDRVFDVNYFRRITIWVRQCGYDDKKTFASYNHGDADLDLANTYSGEVFQLRGRVYAVIPAADAHLQIVDITDPQDIELKGKLPLDLDGRIDNLAVFEHEDGWYAIAPASASDSVQLVRLASWGSAQGDSAADFDINIPDPLSNLLEVRVEPEDANVSTISGAEFTTSGAKHIWKLSDTDRSSGPASFTANYDFGALNVVAAKLTIGPQSSQSRVELPIPQDLRFSVHSDRLELAWDAVVDLANRVTGYRIFRKGPGDSALQSYADVTGKDTNIYADADIEPDTTYTYAVAALGADSSQGEQSASATVTTFLPPPPNSPATGALPPPNSPATGAPTIGGKAQVGETLTAVTSGISDADGLSNAAYGYQWLADDAGISGATNASYTLAETPTRARPSRCGCPSPTTRATGRR